MRRGVRNATACCGIAWSVLCLPAAPAQAEVCNLKVVTDASPDYSDLPSMVGSITGKWKTPAEKCWAMFYWNHIGRRQTEPIILHGLACGDPIRQFNDYGYAMCSTIAGINCAIWNGMGLKVKYWDIHVHTVPEVEYDGKWHMYDNSLSALYTLCDGKTIAGVEDIGKDGACDASGGKTEPGHIARYHCLTATSPNGFLSGADCARSLESEGGHVFRAPGLQYRWYYYDWDTGHRYILNVRDNESYTRYFHRLDKSGTGDETKEGYKHVSDPAYYVPNPGVGNKDPESVNPRYRLRGNGAWTFKPALTAAEYAKSVYAASNIVAAASGGLHPGGAGAGEVVFRVQSANVTTSQRIRAAFTRKSPEDRLWLFSSVDNGLNWKEVWTPTASGAVPSAGDLPVDLRLIGEVNGSYEPMLKVRMEAKGAPADVCLKSLEIETVTELNAKTQPRLNPGRNTVYVGAGSQADSIVFWPDLQGDAWKSMAVDHKNIVTDPKHVGWHAVMRQAAGGEAYVVYRMDAPRDITQLVYGGRMYNNGAGPRIDFLHSFDGGKTWVKSYSLTDGKPPFDVIHFESVDKVPAGTRSVLFKYVIVGNNAPGEQSWGFYAMRMEAAFKPVAAAFKPVEVTYRWNEVRKDGSSIARSHTQLIDRIPFRYMIDVGGDDLPVMDSLTVNLKGAVPDAKYGYSDGGTANPPGQAAAKYAYRWRTEGRNLAEGKPYTVSVPSGSNWGAGDPQGKRLTDGVVGPNYAGTPAPAYGLLWNDGQVPEITVDLGKTEKCGAFRIHLSAGWPWWDAMKGEVRDKVEVLTSTDGSEYASQGMFVTDVHPKDVPINQMLADDETATGWNFERIPEKPVDARYVRFKLTAARSVVVSEVQVFDAIRYEPFDLRIALPGEY